MTFINAPRTWYRAGAAYITSAVFTLLAGIDLSSVITCSRDIEVSLPLIDTDAIVIQQGGWRDSLTVRRNRQGQNRRITVNINSQRTSNTPQPAVEAKKETMFKGMVDKGQTMDDLTRMMQQGIHAGIDMVEDVVRGFEAGANDYLRKPFGMLELIVRIKALAGRIFIPVETPQEEPTTYVIGDYQLDTMKEKLIYANDNNMVSIIPLSHRESEILRLLCRNKGEVVDNKDVLLQLWGDDSYFNTRSLHVFITKLRRKLSRDPRIRIINVMGIGYKLI